MSEGMTLAELRSLAFETAGHLRNMTSMKWELFPAGPDDADDSWPSAELVELDGPARLKIQYGHDAADKITVTGILPTGQHLSRGERRAYGLRGSAFKRNVSPSRGARPVASVARQVLNGGYLSLLPSKVEAKAAQDARRARRDSWLEEAAGLFEVDRRGHADKLYLSDFTTLSSNVSVSGPYTEGDKMTVSIELNGLDPATALAMLKVLAGSQQAHAVCCRKYGSGHDQRLSRLGCLRSSKRADPPTTAEAEALYDLYRFAHGAHSWETWLAGTEVHPAWR